MHSAVATLTRSKSALAVLIGAVLLAVAATGVGYAAMSKTVTLSLDGKTRQVHTFDDKVGAVLKDQGITDLALPWGQMVTYLILAVVVGVAAAVLPAVRAAR